MKELSNISVIGFDADDTLWINETLFRKAEAKFFALLESFEVSHIISKELYRTELENLSRYGYGIKSFTLCLVETAIRISGGSIPAESISKILEIGKELGKEPVELLPNVKDTLARLSEKYELILVTKGDLVDQERKLRLSKLENHFHHIEILSEKKPENYSKLLNHLDINPDQFLMVGNSLKSDILPVLEIGSHAIHIPFHTTWIHEEVESHELEGKEYVECQNIGDTVELLDA